MAENVFAHRGGRVHFIGVGGSSMSGLAALLAGEGFSVSGSDRTRSHKTDALAAKGIDVHIGHRAENVRGADVVVYSAAIAEDNPERAEAARLGVPQVERCDLIGQLMEGVPFAIGVSGTHGKTTTTSMLAQAFLSAGADPTIHIGGELDFIGGSTRRGDGRDFIVEACEFHASFLHFHPTVAIVLNIDEDHLDFFRDIDHIERTFAEYVALLPEDGWCIAWGDDPRARRVCEGAKCRKLTYGLGGGLRPAGRERRLRRGRPRDVRRRAPRRAARQVSRRRFQSGQYARQLGRGRRGAHSRLGHGKGRAGAFVVRRRAPPLRADERHRRRSLLHGLRAQPGRDPKRHSDRRTSAARNAVVGLAAAHLFAHEDAVSGVSGNVRRRRQTADYRHLRRRAKPIRATFRPRC